MYIYIYIYTYRLPGTQIFMQALPSFTMLRSSLKYGGVFSPKKATKKAFHGGDFWEKLMGREYMKGLMT